jgi:hypothetical protein
VVRFLWRTIGVLVLLAAPRGVCGQDAPITWKSLGLRGQVREVVEQELADNLATPKQLGVVFATKTTTFSPVGEALSFESCVPSCDETRFSWQRGLVQEERRRFANGSPEETVRYVRDSAGRIIEELTFEGGDLFRRVEIAQSETRKEISTYYGDTLVEMKVTAQGERAGMNNVELHLFESDDMDGGKGALRLHSAYQESDTQLENGVMRREQSSPNWRTTVTTNADARLLEEVRDVGESFHRETHQYDSVGRESEKAEWNKDGTSINRREYIYVNDERGNWIRRTELFSSSAMKAAVEGEVTVRTISYY